MEDVLRFENMHERLPEYLHSLGLPLGDQQLPQLNTARNRLNYRSYYNDELRALVESMFAYEFERFGYRF